MLACAGGLSFDSPRDRPCPHPECVQQRTEGHDPLGKGAGLGANFTGRGLGGPQAACSVLSGIVTGVPLCSFRLLRRGQGAALGSTETPIKTGSGGPGGQGRNLCTLPSHTGPGGGLLRVPPASSLASHLGAPSPLQVLILRPCAEAAGAAARAVGPRAPGHPGLITLWGRSQPLISMRLSVHLKISEQPQD